jgi:putative flippase GtrA
MSKYHFIFRFLFVGGSTAFIFFGLTFALTEGLQISAVLASTCACIIVVCYNYALHYYWTFESEAPHGVALVRYIFMGTCGILLNGLVMYFGIMFENIHYMVVQVIAAMTMVLWSLSLSYFWVFRSNR